MTVGRWNTTALKRQLNIRLFSLLLTLLLVGCDKQSAKPLVNGGQLEGFSNDNVKRYLGIPYTRSPILLTMACTWSSRMW